VTGRPHSAGRSLVPCSGGLPGDSFAGPARRLRPLRAGLPARFQRYDWPTGTLGEWIGIRPPGSVVAEGVYLLRPWLRPYRDFSIYVDTPRELRQHRLHARGENDEDWIARWTAAEDAGSPLVVVLACALVRLWGWPEAVASLAAAVVVLGAGAISLDQARAEAELLGPVIGFLAAVLVLAQCCDGEGLFRACGAWMARTAARRPRRLLVAVFVLASVVTAVLSLDAAVVLLTPVVFATAARLGARPRPHVYACTHLSNTASVLLPISNLTNLLAFAASGLSFTRFAALMALPWLVAIGAEYAVFQRFFATDLDAGAPASAAGGPPEVPVFALAVVAATLAGLVVASAAGVNPAWAALAGGAVLGGRALAQRRTTPAALASAANVPFLAFVLRCWCLDLIPDSDQVRGIYVVTNPDKLSRLG